MATVTPRTSELVPGEERRCVWMSAGFVAYKLCDRDFDCENCPLDRALRGEDPAPATERGPAPPTAAWRFPDDRRYHPGHTWVAPIESGERGGAGPARIGLDAFAARLVGPAVAVIAPADGTRLRPGEAACWLAAGGEAIAVRAPVGGTVRRRNPRIADDPALVAAAPYDEGWLLEIDPGGAPGDAPRTLLAAAEARARAERRLAEAHAEVARLTGAAAVGPTLPDGGEPAADLRTLLGPARHRRLLKRYLG